MPGVALIKGDATERWPLEDNTLDSIVTDPPYGIAFMGKSWDDKGGPAAYQEWSASWAREAFRCLKPGGFLLAFGATRMAHRMTCGFEDAGFEILDGIEWLYLSGMPKAQDIGKLYDKQNGRSMEERLALAGHITERREAAGESREAVNSWFGYADGCQHWERTDRSGNRVPTLADWAVLSERLSLSAEYLPLVERAEAERQVLGIKHKKPPGTNLYGDYGDNRNYQVTAPATDLARQWDGWKTASLKPAHEPIVVARKPFPGTYCENLEQWGVGAINVDGCRVVWDGEKLRDRANHNIKGGAYKADNSSRERDTTYTPNGFGRFPANVVMSHGPDCTPEACQDGCPVKVLDAQSEPRMHSAGFARAEKRECEKTGRFWKNAGDGHRFGDGGGASKVFAKFFWDQDDYAAFYYCPKASQRDRNEGCAELPEGNNHATVKPTGLIRYLQRLVTPPGGLTGSPFLGSGTDAVAAIHEEFAFWGMNLPDRPGEEYWPIIDARVAHALKGAGEPPKQTATTEAKQQPAPPAVPEQVRFSFDQAEGTVNP